MDVLTIVALCDAKEVQYMQHRKQTPTYTIGFEFETNLMAFSSAENMGELKKSYSFDNQTSIHADYWPYHQQQGRHKLYEFSQSIQGPVYDINMASGEVITVPTRLMKVNAFFNDAEFVVTFPTMVQVKEKSLYTWIMNNFRVACHKVITNLEKFKQDDILNHPFPYTRSYKYNGMYLFSRNIDPMDANFYCQFTITVDIHYSKQLMMWFHDLARTFKINDTIYTRTEQICKNVFHETYQGRWVWLENYLFLFIYSFLTRDSRKTHFITIRVLFANIWKDYIGEAGRSLLFSLLSKTDGVSIKMLVYFQQVHGLMQLPSQLTSQELQEMTSTTYFTFTDRIGIEFRAFNHTILKSIFKSYDPSKQNFSLRTWKTVIEPQLFSRGSTAVKN